MAVVAAVLVVVVTPQVIQASTMCRDGNGSSQAQEEAGNNDE